MTRTEGTTPNIDAKESARLERVAAIRDAAITRQQLGILWQHRLDLIGQHVVYVFDRDAGQLREFIGATLDEAISAAKRWRAGR